MDKCFFLIVADGDSEIFHHNTPSHIFLQSILCSQCNAAIYIIVPNLSTLRQFRDEFPGANCILLNIDKDVETDKQFLTSLPEMDCIMDFTGKLDSKILCWVQTIQIAAKVTLKMKYLDVPKIHEILNANNTIEGLVLINVLPPKSDQNIIKAATRAAIKKGEKVMEALQSDPNKSPLQFRPGRKFSAHANTTTSISCQPSSSSSPPSTMSMVEQSLSRLERVSSDREPLLARQRVQYQPEVNFSFSSSGFISCLRQYCGCCFFTQDPILLTPTLPQFTSHAQRQNFIRGKQHEYVRKKFNLVFDQGEETWGRILRKVDSQEKEEASAIRAKYASMKEERMNKYDEICAKNKENPATVDILVKAAAHREKSALDKMQWIEKDLAKDLDQLKKKYAGDKEAKGEEQHYVGVVQEQLRVLRRAQDKCEQLGQLLRVVR